jgi:hypothetical protein
MSGLFAKPPKIKPPPPPAPMPDQDDVAARQARRLAMEKAQRRGGRESTILSSETTGDYSKKELG